MSLKKGFESLEVWKKGREYRIFVSKVLKDFPKEEKFRLVDQLIRASRSITANIAEGYGRFHHQENIQFCRIARGSLTETLDHFICAYDENFIKIETLNQVRVYYNHLLKLLNGYIHYLKKQKVFYSNKPQ